MVGAVFRLVSCCFEASLHFLCNKQFNEYAVRKSYLSNGLIIAVFCFPLSFFPSHFPLSLTTI